MSKGLNLEMVRVLIVSSDSLARASLEASLSRFDDLGVVGVADLDEDLAASVDAFRPDVVLAIADDGADISNQLERLVAVDLPLLMLSDQRLDRDSPADGWLSYGSSPDQIRAAILAIGLGLIVLDRDQVHESLSPHSRSNEAPNDPLTPRELEVLQLIAEGLTNRAIAFQLGISEFTVKFHVNAILSKLEAQSRTEASVKAARFGLIML